MKIGTGSVSMICRIWLRNSLRPFPSFGCGARGCAVSERGGERRVDELVLLDQRQAVARARDDVDLEAVAAAGAVVHGDVGAGKDGQGACGSCRSRWAMMLTMGSRIAFPTSFPERAPLAEARGKP